MFIIVESIVEMFDLYGVMVVVEVEYMCMMMCGVRKLGVKIVILVVRGVFKDDVVVCVEVLEYIKCQD